MIVWSDELQQPVAIRHAFEKNPEGCSNLYNEEGLPAASCSTDQYFGTAAALPAWTATALMLVKDGETR